MKSSAQHPGEAGENQGRVGEPVSMVVVVQSLSHDLSLRDPTDCSKPGHLPGLHYLLELAQACDR